mgnify:FL=1
MIDTDKYEEYQTARVEGFIPAEWEFEDYLLAEVKRLREQLGRYTQFVLWVEEEHNEIFHEYERKDEL